MLYVDPNSTKYRPTSDEWSEARRRRLGPSVTSLKLAHTVPNRDASGGAGAPRYGTDRRRPRFPPIYKPLVSRRLGELHL